MACPATTWRAAGGTLLAALDGRTQLGGAVQLGDGGAAGAGVTFGAPIRGAVEFGENGVLRGTVALRFGGAMYGDVEVHNATVFCDDDDARSKYALGYACEAAVAKYKQLGQDCGVLLRQISATLGETCALSCALCDNFSAPTGPSPPPPRRSPCIPHFAPYSVAFCHFICCVGAYDLFV